MTTYLWLDYEARIWFGLILPKLNIVEITNQEIILQGCKGYVSNIKTDNGCYNKLTIALSTINSIRPVLNALYPNLTYKQLVNLECRLETTFIDNLEYAFVRKNETGLYLNRLAAPTPLRELAQYELKINEHNCPRRAVRVYYLTINPSFSQS